MEQKNDILNGMSRVVNLETVRPGISPFQVERKMTVPPKPETLATIDADLREYYDVAREAAEQFGIEMDADPLPSRGPSRRPSISFEDNSMPPRSRPASRPVSRPASPPIAGEEEETFDAPEDFGEDVDAEREKVENFYADQTTREVTAAEYEKFKHLSLIDSYISSLEALGEDHSNVRQVDDSSTPLEVAATMELLRLKLEAINNSSLGMDAAMTLVDGLENVFDGSRKLFDRFTFDLTGWRAVAEPQIRRSKLRLGEVVHDTCDKLGVGELTKLALGLTASAISYSNSRTSERHDTKANRDQKRFQRAVRDLKRERPNM